MAARHVITLKIDHPGGVRLFFHRASDAARAAMRASDSEPHAAFDRVVAVRALTAPRSMGDGRTSRPTPSRGRADADSENGISNPAGVLYPQSSQTKYIRRIVCDMLSVCRASISPRQHGQSIVILTFSASNRD
jgi:hypothetical protein